MRFIFGLLFLISGHSGATTCLYQHSAHTPFLPREICFHQLDVTLDRVAKVHVKASFDKVTDESTRSARLTGRKEDGYFVMHNLIDSKLYITRGPGHCVYDTEVCSQEGTCWLHERSLLLEIQTDSKGQVLSIDRLTGYLSGQDNACDPTSSREEKAIYSPR
jgi:hypothetical protein